MNVIFKLLRFILTCNYNRQERCNKSQYSTKYCKPIEGNFINEQRVTVNKNNSNIFEGVIETNSELIEVIGTYKYVFYTVTHFKYNMIKCV